MKCFILLFSLIVFGDLYGKSSPIHKFSSDDKKRLAFIIQNNHYLKPKIDREALSNTSLLNEFLATLDPYSKFFNAKEMRFKRERSEKIRLGIGLDLLIEENRILGIPVKDGPAYKAGLISPIYINTIDDKEIDPSNFESYSFLTGFFPRQNVAIETISKDEVDLNKYRINVDKFEQKYSFLTRSEGYDILTIRQFSDETTEKIKVLMSSMSSRKPLIIDLRHNPGGDLYATVDTLSFFLKNNLEVAFLKEKDFLIPLHTVSEKVIINKEIIILLSSFTASSAEIFAQAIKNFLPETKLIGLPSAGKCLAQKTYILKNKSAIQLSSFNVLNAKKELCQNEPLDIDLRINDSETKSIKTIITELSLQL